jgi:hypothetical protein
LWDVARRLPLGTALGNQSSGGNLAFAGHDNVLVVSTFASTGFRRLRPDAWEHQACAIAGRNLTRAEWRQFLGDGDYRETCPGRRSAGLFAATDPSAYFVPIPGYPYGEKFDAAVIRRFGLVQGRSVTNAVSGDPALMAVAHASCFPPTACVEGAGPLTPTTLSGEPVSTFLYSIGELRGVAWRPRPYDLEVFVLASTQDLANDIMTKLIRAKANS